MPFGDWQFYVVTLATAWGFYALYRTLRPARRKPAGKRTPLTIDGKKPSCH